MQIKLTPVSEGGLLPTTLDDVVTLCRATPAAPICSPAGDAVDQLCSVLSTLPLCTDANVSEVAGALARAEQGGDSTTSPSSQDPAGDAGSTPDPSAGGGGSDNGLVELIGGLLGGGSS
jgi:phospholipid/cholesterol/gamma-HCH transport system substrate-binding protein